MNKDTWAIAWKMLSPKEKKMALAVLAVAILGAIGQVLMVGSIMPFLSYLANPGDSMGHPVMARIQAIFGIETAFGMVVLLGLSSIGLILISTTLLLLRSYAISRFTMMRIHTLSTKLLSSYLRRPYEYFLGRNSGDLGKRILAETNEISTNFLQPAAEMISSAIAALFIFGLLLYVSPVATLAGVSCILVVYLAIYRWSGRYLKRLGEKRVLANRKRFGVISEVFGGIKDIKVGQKEAVFLSRFDEVSAITMKAQLTARVASQLPQFVIQAFFLSGVIVACLLVVDPSSFASGGAGISSMIPTLGVFAFAGQRIVPEIQKIYAAASKISYGSAAVRNVYEDMLLEPISRPAETDDLRFDRSLDLVNLGYSYPGSERAGIDRLSARIEKGQRVGIVGGTGAGKTTLVDLILGLLEPSQGQLVVDGQPLEAPEVRAAWRSKVAYVPQSIFLTDTSFAENIAFGVPPEEIDFDKVEACARMAQIHDVIINETAEGYASKVGDRGVMLSGGQRQRIGIARALYRDAELIVLDEATSALDGQTERQVMKAIDALPREISVVMIAHRLSTVRNCDAIWVLEKGQLIENGPWDDLEAKGGAFAALLDSARE